MHVGVACSLTFCTTSATTAKMRGGAPPRLSTFRWVGGAEMIVHGRMDVGAVGCRGSSAQRPYTGIERVSPPSLLSASPQTTHSSKIRSIEERERERRAHIRTLLPSATLSVGVYVFSSLLLAPRTTCVCLPAPRPALSLSFPLRMHQHCACTCLSFSPHLVPVAQTHPSLLTGEGGRRADVHKGGKGEQRWYLML